MSASQNKIYRFLDTNGNGTGTKVANGNYSGAVEQFYFESDGYCQLHRMIVHLEDTTGFQAEEYGNLGSVLTNGISIKVIDSDGVTVLKDLTDGLPIKSNAQWARVCYDVQLYDWGAGNQALGVRWTFEKSGSPISLSEGERLVVELNDDLTGLLDHTFMVQGEYQ